MDSSKTIIDNTY